MHANLHPLRNRKSCIDPVEEQPGFLATKAPCFSHCVSLSDLFEADSSCVFDERAARLMLVPPSDASYRFRFDRARQKAAQVLCEIQASLRANPVEPATARARQSGKRELFRIMCVPKARAE